MGTNPTIVDGTFTDEAIALYWPDLDHPEGRAAIRRELAAVLSDVKAIEAARRISVPDQVRGALQFLASDTRCSERERAALRDLREHGTDPVLTRLRGLLR